MVRTGLLVAALTLTAASSCEQPGSGSGSGKPRVAVSIFPIYDLTRRIAGDRFDVVLVLPPGRSEHDHDPTPKEIARLEGARLGIVVGHGLDGWAEKLMGDTRVVRIAEQVPTIPIDHARGAPDPHVWLDPDRMIGAVDAIAAELAAIDPAGKDAIAQNAAGVKDSLRKLDAAIAARAKTWTKRTIVTFHGSMAYYAQRYGLRIAAVVEPIAGKEPTPSQLRDVQAAIARSRAAALFTEPQLDRGPGEMIAKQAGIPLGELDPVGGIAGRDSYEALLRWNTDQLERVLR
jgi:zinc transport system substrate-binding protein